MNFKYFCELWFVITDYPSCFVCAGYFQISGGSVKLSGLWGEWVHESDLPACLWNLLDHSGLISAAASPDHPARWSQVSSRVSNDFRWTPQTVSTLVPDSSLESPISLMCMSLDCGRKCGGSAHKNIKLDLNAGPWWRVVTVNCRINVLHWTTVIFLLYTHCVSKPPPTLPTMQWNCSLSTQYSQENPGNG